MLKEFVKSELTSYINDNRLTQNQELIKIICKAFEAYDEYKKLVSDEVKPKTENYMEKQFRMVNTPFYSSPPSSTPYW